MVRHYTILQQLEEGHDSERRSVAVGTFGPPRQAPFSARGFFSIFCFFELPVTYCSCFFFSFAAFASGSCTGGRFTGSPMGPVLISRTAFFSNYFSVACAW